ncbi:uncharacterized protein LOC127803181 [Diospyros lotus]|uniref:uncharacterized protein LOC127803181 n=1 Tax=Diospyros lotus TaxID=55363 RepID=UPI00225608C0|nr:uncharacterized protein LOC127803181 [Diospyros lotus]
MPRNCAENEVDDEEEALSLCDLPIKGEDQSRNEAQSSKTGDDFDFGSWSASVLTEPEMCAADEVFFQGQILPFRHSISSESGLAVLRMDSRSPSRSVSRSESMDHCYSGGFASVSSRSSSIRSHHSSSSGSSTTTAIATKKQRVRNQFQYSHPSPTPQIRVSASRYGNVSLRSRKSNLWSYFQVGLVRTPGNIQLQDIKLPRGNNNRSSNNKNFGSRNSSSSSNGFSGPKKEKQNLFDRNGPIFGGCKCSVNAVDTVPSSVIIVKSNSAHNNGNEARSGEEEEEEEERKKTKQQKVKQAVSRHRTFEWLKELSLAGVPDES